MKVEGVYRPIYFNVFIVIFHSEWSLRRIHKIKSTFVLLDILIFDVSPPSQPANCSRDVRSFHLFFAHQIIIINFLKRLNKSNGKCVISFFFCCKRNDGGGKRREPAENLNVVVPKVYVIWSCLATGFLNRCNTLKWHKWRRDNITPPRRQSKNGECLGCVECDRNDNSFVWHVCVRDNNLPNYHTCGLRLL